MQLAFDLDEARARLAQEPLCDSEEASVAAALPWGRSNAKRIDDIADEIGLPARRVQSIVLHLIHEHFYPIGTAMSMPFGNYLIDDADELAETVALLRVRGISNLSRAAALRKMSLRDYLATVQTELEV